MFRAYKVLRIEGFGLCGVCSALLPKLMHRALLRFIGRYRLEFAEMQTTGSQKGNPACAAAALDFGLPESGARVAMREFRQ